jgi:hypothetical protein
MTTRLFVGNLPYNATDAVVRENFAGFGVNVEHVYVPADRETGKGRGFAFVEVSEDAARALALCTGITIEHRVLRLEVATSVRNAPGGGKKRMKGAGSADRVEEDW